MTRWQLQSCLWFVGYELEYSPPCTLHYFYYCGTLIFDLQN